VGIVLKDESVRGHRFYCTAFEIGDKEHKSRESIITEVKG